MPRLGKTTHLPPLKLEGTADMADGVIGGKPACADP